ncbi:MAG: DUF6273 domain-containing protein [Oscillospiraceae bacterium]|jgi:hypothetical protein|nr:DUF6273 domain-containing protein [Oscillospiraceae bacterium]
MAVKSVEPYTGSEPYIFISYAHVDKEQVYPILDEMGRLGYRLWWDKAIVPAKDWMAEIEKHLEGAESMVLFSSKAAFASKNVMKEIKYAVNYKNEEFVLSVFLEPMPDKQFPYPKDSGLNLYLGSVQFMKYFERTSDAAFYKELSKPDVLPVVTRQRDLAEELRIAKVRIQELEAENKHLSVEHRQLTARILALKEELNTENGRSKALASENEILKAERVKLNERIKVLEAQPIAPPKPKVVLTKGQKAYSFAGYNWRVLDVKEGRALLLSENVIEPRAYNVGDTATTWAECTLRKYLNGEFYNGFSGEDRGRILRTHNRNPKNPWYDTAGGNDTDDHIFLLSLEEVFGYFGTYAKVPKQEGSIWVDDAYNDERKCSDLKEAGSWWWLRSPGGHPNRAAHVNFDGIVDLFGDPVHGSCGGVRPALWLNLES